MADSDFGRKKDTLTQHDAVRLLLEIDKTRSRIMPNAIKIIFSVVSVCCLPIIGYAACPSAFTATTSHLTGDEDGTVTDSKTGLMWKRCSEGQTFENDGCTGDVASYNWRFALDQVTVANTEGFANHSDWRLPNVKELTSILELQCYQPAINLGAFPNTPSNATFWSSSPHASDNASAWMVRFEFGSGSWDAKSRGFQIRLVRDAQ